jgi:hypothetical protein
MIERESQELDLLTAGWQPPRPSAPSISRAVRSWLWLPPSTSSCSTSTTWAFDGWSIGRLIREFAACYSATL